jgi:energy-coupling factor transporter ATP-binding protein EcfA2
MVELEKTQKVRSSFQAAAEKIEQGHLPSNEEITGIIDTTKLVLDQESANLDEQGKRLVLDIQDILSASKAIILSANDHERLQKFVDDVTEFTKDMKRRTERPIEELKGDVFDALNEAKELIYDIRYLLLYIIRSTDFRIMINDIMDLMQDVFGPVEKRKSYVKEAIKTDVEKEDISATTTREEVKESVKNIKEQAQEGELVDEETKQRVRDHIFSLLKTLSSHHEYHMAINHIFNIIDLFNRRMDQLQKDPNMTLEGDEQFNKLLEDVKLILIEIFGKSFTKFNQDFWILCRKLRVDKDANEFFSDFRSFLDEFSKNADKLKDQQLVKQKISNLVDRWYAFYDRERSKYVDDFNLVYEDFMTMMDYGSQQTFDIQEKLFHFAQDLVTNSQGKPDLYVTQDSLIQLKNILVPLFQKRLANIPIPTIEGSNDTYDFRFEDILMDGRNFMPEHFHFRVITDLDLSKRSDKENRFLTRILFKIDDMSMVFKNMKFHYWRKSIPRFEDHGICNVAITGLNLRLTWYLFSQAGCPTIFRLATVKSTIDDLKIHIIKSDHSIIDNVVATLFPGYIKNQISKGLVENIKNFMKPINDQLNDYLKQHMDIFHSGAQDTQKRILYGRQRYRATEYPVKTVEKTQEKREPVEATAEKKEKIWKKEHK